MYMQLSSQPSMYEPCTTLNYADTDWEVHLMFTSHHNCFDFDQGGIVGAGWAALSWYL